MNPITIDQIKEVIQLPFEARNKLYYNPTQYNFFIKQNSNCSARNFLRYNQTFLKIWETKKVIKFPSGGITPRAIRNSVNGALKWITTSAQYDYPWFKEEYSYTDEDVEKLREAINKERLERMYSILQESTIVTVVLDQTYLKIKKQATAIVEPVEGIVISDQQYLEEVSGVERESFGELSKKIEQWADVASPGDQNKLPTQLDNREMEMINELIEGLGDRGIIGSVKANMVLLYRKQEGE